MKLPGQEEFEVSSACENVPTGELENGPGSCPSPDGTSDTDRGDRGVPTDPLLFIQLNELLGWPQALEWRETGRWVLFEEKLEVGAGRWSVPHVPTLALPSLQKLRSLLAEGLVLLDCPAQSFLELVEQVTRVESLSPELRGQLQALLLQRPQHLIQPTGTRPCQGSAHPREASHNEEAPLKEQRQNPLRRKLPPGAEAGAVLAGELGFLARPLGAFVRLRDPVVLGPLTEVPLPSRFFCLLLGPSTLGRGYHEMGRAMAVLLSDRQFQWSVRRASSLHDLLAALDAFLEEVTVLPPGRWDPTARIAPPKCLPSQHKRLLSQLREVKGPSAQHGALAEDRHGHWPHAPSPELQRTGRGDVRRKALWYTSDFLDALHPQCFSAVLYIYLATITNAITFGGLLGEATDGAQGVLESFLGTAVAGAAFCLMAGQPLTILSSTGPVLVFERLLFSFSRLQLGLPAFPPMGGHLGGHLLSGTSGHRGQRAGTLLYPLHRKEGFCALISLIFIYDAVGKMLSLTSAYPIQSPGSPAYGCFCQYPDLGGNESQWKKTEPKDRGDISSMARETLTVHRGPDICCGWRPPILGPWCLTTALKHVKTSRFFPSVVRKVLGDFSSVLAMLLGCGLDSFLGLATPKLMVPGEFKGGRAPENQNPEPLAPAQLPGWFPFFCPLLRHWNAFNQLYMHTYCSHLPPRVLELPTLPGRGWLVSPFGTNPWWLSVAAALPALLLSILIFMDQQITAVILNRAEYKLRKGAGFHLDLFCVAVLLLLTSVLGLPWYVSATVISLAHMDSLRRESTACVLGEPRSFLGIREQRLTGLVVFILTGASIFLAPVLKFIPMPVLYGIFLYMGVAAISSIQVHKEGTAIIDASKTPARPPPLETCASEQGPPLHSYPACLPGSALDNQIYSCSHHLPPHGLLGLVGVRKALEWVFSPQELLWLDELMPEKERNIPEKGLEPEYSLSGDTEDSELMYQPRAPEINISVN
ncbi:anion exchange protein 4 isoform X2 [Prionailurus iriomotensis]